MRIEQYFLMTDYALWEVIVNGDSPPPKRTIDGVEKIYPPTTTEEKLARKNELKARGTLLMALPNEHQLKFNTYKCAKSLMEAIEKRFGGNKESKKTQKTLLKQQYENFNGSSSEGLDQTYNRLQKLINQLEIIDNKDLQKIDADDLEEMDLKWQMAMPTMRARRFLNKTGRKISANGSKTIEFNKSKVECYNCHKKGHFARECRAPRENMNIEPIRRNVTVEITEVKVLVAQDRLGYDWSDQAEERPTNFAFMAYTSSSSSSSDSEVSTCSKACLKSYETLKEHYDNLTKDFNKSQLNVGAYKAGLESVEARLDVYKKNEAVFEEDIKILKLDIQVSDKFKTGVRFDSQVFDSQENDKYKTSEGYHVVPPPYIGNFMSPKSYLVLADEDEYVFSESITSVPDVATSEAKSSKSKPKTVSELLIKDRISDSEDENETKSKSEQRKSSFAKVEFVKSNEHVKTPKESVKKVENNKQAKYPRKNSQSPRGNQRNWNNLMTQKLGSNFEFKNKACYVCGSFNHLIKDCDFYEKKMAEKPVWNNAKRVNHQNSQRMTHPHPKRNFVPRAILMKSGLKTLNTDGKNSSRAAVSVNTARPINTAYPRPIVNCARPASNVFNRAHSHHLSDGEESNHEDASDTGAAPKQPQPMIYQTTAISNIKLPILKTTRNGNSKKRISIGKDGVVRVLSPVTAAEIQAVEKERKAKNILLMAIPKEHMRRFHGMDDAKEIWEAIRTRFGGNANSKKMQKAVFKQQFEAFKISNSEGLEKGYDRFQQLLSQLEAHGAEVSTEDANHKFLRSLPSAWSNLAMTMRTNPEIDNLSIDDLYNNLRVFEQEIQGAPKTSSSAQNVAFVSQSKSSTNKVKSGFSGAYSSCTPSTSSTNIPEKEVLAGFADEVIYSLFAKQTEDLDLLHEDLEQIDDVDIEEMDINWQIAMIAIRMKKFYKKTGRRVRVDGKTPGIHDGKKKRDSLYQHQEAGKQEKNQMGLLTMDDGIVNWGEHTEAEETNHALMAISSSNEVSLCSKTCIDSYNKLKLLYDEQMNQLGDQEAQILAYSQAVKKLEAQLVTSQKQHLSLNEKLAFQANEIHEKDEKLKRYRRIGMKAVKEKEQLQKTVDSWKDSSKNLWKDSMGKPSYSRFTKTNDFKGVPHPLSGDYTPKPQEEIDDSFLNEPNELSKSRLEVTNEKDVSAPKSKEVEPSCVSHIKTPRQPLKDKETHKVNRKNWNDMMERELGEGYSFTKKKCFVCGSLSHLIKDCDYYEKKMAREAEVKRVVNTGNGVAKPVWTNANRVNHANKFVPRSVQLNAGRPNFNTVRPNINTGRTNINSVRPKVNVVSPKVNTVRSRQPVPHKTSNSVSPKRPQMNQINQRRDFSKSHSSVRRPFAKTTAQMSHSNAVMGSWGSAVKTSASYNWRNSRPNFHYNSGPTFNRTEHPLKNMVDRGIFDSGCSGHMTGNKDQLEDFEEFNGGSVTFGGSKGYISGKGKIRVGNLDFDSVSFVKELGHFNLFSISQICDKQHKVLFTETECLVVSSDFKMPDENQILLKVPRHHNMYSFDMKTPTPAKGFACLIAKATSDESKLWHRRLGHINFKNLNKLVKGNLVRGLPSKVFKNDHTCVACHKGKQHRASCKAKLERLITEPLHTLHMDLFGPTSVKSINHASYCLVITDDCTRFSWVFFLASKDETSGILQNFIRQIENQLSHRVKIIRSDNGTEFKNRDMLEFCGNKGIKQEYSNARTPQHNGVAERMNRIQLEVWQF
ncbi:putative ribonuclease H-like domain-containing protein [Tanacetum coccineum]|uniref:Ribonuclease H-like domain-containing protein n=1 Tax=Tanacetum coccineum TaxID=301880 RepID=A0ABQ4Y8D6_9ASTR